MNVWKARLYRAGLKLYPKPLWQIRRDKEKHFTKAGDIPQTTAEGVLSALRKAHTVGGAVVLFDEKGVTGALYYGDASYQEGKTVTVDENTVFRTASISKHITAMMIWRLYEAGKIDLDADADAFLPVSLRHPSAPDKRVTLRRLLSHTAGIHDGSAYLSACRSNPPLEDFFPGDCFATAPDGFEYSNFGAGLAACVLEGMLKTDFETLAQETLFKPHHISASFYPQRISGEIADSFRVLPPQREPMLDNQIRKNRPKPELVPDPSRHYLLSQGNLYITASDLARLGCELMQPRYAPMRKSVVSFGARDAHLHEGLGTFIYRDECVCSPILYGHQGLAYGGMNGLFYNPGEKKGFVLLTSGASEARTGVMSDLNKAIIRQVFHQ